MNVNSHILKKTKERKRKTSKGKEISRDGGIFHKRTGREGPKE